MFSDLILKISTINDKNIGLSTLLSRILNGEYTKQF